MKKLELICNCDFHKITLEEFTVNNLGVYLDVHIYTHKSPTTGKLLDIPVLLGDVILSPDDVNKLREFLKDAK